MSFAGIAFGATSLTKARLTSLIKECRGIEGTEVVRLGGFATGAMKGLIRIAGSGDPDTKEFLRIIGGIKSISIMEYEDCASVDRVYISERIARLLEDAEVLEHCSPSILVKQQSSMLSLDKSLASCQTYL